MLGLVRHRAVLSRLRSASAVWIALLVVAGVLASIFGARAVVRQDSASSHAAFKASTAEIASGLKLSLRREDDLVVAAGAFIAGNPDASQTEFLQWTRSARVMERYPELQSIGEVVLVPASQVKAFAREIVADPPYPLPADGRFQIVPPGPRPAYCFAATALARTAVSTPVGLDYCAKGRGLTVRDSGHGAYRPYVEGKQVTLIVQSPVYRGGVVPPTVSERRSAFLGTLAVSVLPKHVLDSALRGHPGTSLRLRYRFGSSNAVFSGGKAPADARSDTVDLSDGWSLRVFAAAPGRGVWNNRDALLVLFGGIALSVLVGVFLLLVVRLNRRLAGAARQSAHDALHDPLTGLPNRELFSDRLEHALATARRDPAPLAVLMVDLNRFKEINDTLGHSTGDGLLREIGPRLAAVLRPADTVARFDGDAFSLLLPATECDYARTVADRVIAALREPFTVGELSVMVDASVGIACYPAHGEDAETLVQHADVAMYLAKDNRHAHVLYDPATDPYDPDRLLLIGDLRRAIAEDELELHYQPKFTTSDMRLAGVEALVRWRHPTRGLVPPGDFIPLAEHTGAIRPLTLLVLRKAARQWRDWHEHGLDITIAVNLSVANLLDGELIDDIACILADAQVGAGGLELEITESTVMTDPDRATAMLEQLGAMGIRLSIDDYGTGHSSLAYLRRLPVHELKIDRSFVQHLASDDEDLQIVRSTIDLAHGLGLRVVAEGVEDAQSLTLLQELGCDLAQGFHLGRPVPPDILLDQLRDRGVSIPEPSPV
jgi:diguanylate cyclase (GGDEF)-like protein